MTSQAPPVPRRPLVFQCIECKTIIGDSLSLVVTDEDLQAVVVDYVRDVVDMANEIQTADSTGRNSGTTFKELTCSSCEARLGRFYVSVPRTLSALRDRYAIDIEAISSYELGAPGPPPEDNDHNGSMTFAVNGSIVSRIDSLEFDLRDEIRKVQGVILSLHERLQALENTNTKSSRSRLTR
uniref:Mis18 domain-containing protein n=1 Tax=Aureoumbra lagunensis TaxID=44058 RepID=A0A7S3JQU0_9STRA